MAEHIDPTSGDFDDPEPGSTWFISIAGAVVFTALVLALSVLYYGVKKDQTDIVVIREVPRDLQHLKETQLTELNEYGFYDVTTPDDQVVERLRIPIKRAMELVLQDGGFRTTGAPAPAPAAGNDGAEDGAS